MAVPDFPQTCWIVTDGKIGAINQCLGLAESLGLSPGIKRVALRAPWRQLSPYFRLGHAHAFTADSDALAPPWPDLVIASGRQSVAAALHVRRQSRKAGRASVTVFVQNPGISASHFDLVIAPEHDRVRGRNVVSTVGALHRITRAMLDEGAEKFAPRFAHFPRPYIGVLVGGTNAAYRFGTDEAKMFAARLVRAAQQAGGSLLITPSRRTGERNVEILKAALTPVPHFLWEGTGENPYFGILALADHIVVTGDSVNMVSEAAAAGKPVHVFALPGGTKRFTRFHAAMQAQKLTRPFNGALDAGTPPPAMDDMARAREAVRAALARAAAA